ncbi:hypothetical protein LTR56_009208 [Elasticomyces elasticus]|nr:hypothetical protein LTR56_009208 [Elasticomyces elasticus]KAK3664741.1 hypothetical protein LTR22_004328 [Elasticomyces elasticus]KAK4928551.1 hypothetical protein LTR49_004671 [Elasticomyces elasticus]KAK5765119.1 hypothetical protein LTS12_004630 [Elasticomyces elasticus]
MQSDRTFQFVSDPNHKGPPARKRPHRDLVHQTDGDEVPSPISPAEGASKDSFHQPSTPSQPHSGGALRGSPATSSHTSPSTSSFGGSRRTSADSGRAIHPLPPRRLYRQVPPALQHPDSGARPLTVVPPETSPFAFTQAFRGHQLGGNDGSPVTKAPNERGSVPLSNAGDPPLTSMTTNQTLGNPMQGNQLPGSNPTTRSGSIGTFSRGSIADTAGYSRQQSPDRLLRIADALETEASSLRRLAHYQQVDDLEGQASSLRLLSQQQQNTRTSMEGFEEYGGPAQAMLNYEQGSDPNWVTFGDPTISEAPYQFDPSILRPDGTLRTGFTPPGGDYAMTDIDAHRLQLRYDFGIYNQLQDSQQTPMPATTANGNADQGYGLGIGRMQRVFHERLVADPDAHAAWTRTGGDQDGADEIAR